MLISFFAGQDKSSYGRNRLGYMIWIFRAHNFQIGLEDV